MAWNKSNKSLDRPETIDPSDIRLSRQEVEAIIAVCRIWPAGMGEVLVKCGSKRGYMRDPSFNVYYCDWSKISDEALLCPVMQVKKLRKWSTFAQHLSAFRSIRNAYAEILNVDLRTARLTYNNDLKTNPKRIADLFESNLLLFS